MQDVASSLAVTSHVIYPHHVGILYPLVCCSYLEPSRSVVTDVGIVMDEEKLYGGITREYWYPRTKFVSKAWRWDAVQWLVTPVPAVALSNRTLCRFEWGTGETWYSWTVGSRGGAGTVRRVRVVVVAYRSPRTPHHT